MVSHYCCFIPNFTAIAMCLHQLLGPTNSKRYKGTRAEKPKKKPFIWTEKHLKALDIPKVHLTSTPVLGYQDFSHPFDLKTDALLQGLGTILSQRDEWGRSKITACPSQSLHPKKQLMRNFSLTKLQLLTLKWVVS